MEKPVTRHPQLGFDFGTSAVWNRESLCVSPANASSLAMVDRWPDWPDRVVLLTGPPASGKTHLARIWASTTGASFLTVPQMSGQDLAQLAKKPGLVLDRADAIGTNEASLFHLLNLVREEKSSLLLTARTLPDQWGLTTPDLLSRLRLAPAVKIDPADDALLRGVLRKNFSDRQITVEAGVIDYMIARMERSFAAAVSLVGQMDAEAMARNSAITRQVAKVVLDQLYGQQDMMDDG